MNFNENLKNLRKQKGLTQEELAEALFVSRTAVSKWESGRGFPNIDSLKQIASFFSVSLDDLLSGEEILFIAENEGKQKAERTHHLVFGLSDISASLLLFLPLFGFSAGGGIKEVSLLDFATENPILKTIYIVLVAVLVVVGVLALAFQNRTSVIFRKISFVLNAAAVILFIIGRQPYAAVFLFVFLIIKGFILLTRKVS